MSTYIDEFVCERIVPHSEDKEGLLCTVKRRENACLPTEKARWHGWIQRRQRGQGKLFDTKKTGGIAGYKEDKGNC